jgi:hypothetical protein
MGVNLRAVKPLLQPLCFTAEPDEEFTRQMGALRRLLGEEAEFLPALPVGAAIPAAADAVLLPEVLGAAYRAVPAIKAITVPLLVITSEFGTVSMWDWEIGSRLRAEGIVPLAPTTLEQARRPQPPPWS